MKHVSTKAALEAVRIVRKELEREREKNRLKACFSSASDRWATPPDVYAALNAEFRFDFDPCPLDGTHDGLSTLFTEWKGKRVYCNPPYGPGIGDWLRRGLEADLAVFLIPARTDTRWFHEICLPFAKEIRFIKGRLKFGNAENSAPFPSMVVVFEKPSLLDAPDAGAAAVDEINAGR